MQREPVRWIGLRVAVPVDQQLPANASTVVALILLFGVLRPRVEFPQQFSSHAYRPAVDAHCSLVPDGQKAAQVLIKPMLQAP
jgi:hypothetical protein